VLIELFSLGVTAEALRANIDWKPAFLKGVVNITDCIHTRKLRSRLSSELHFVAENSHFAFLSPLWRQLAL